MELCGSAAEYAKFVSFRISEHNPGHVVTLTDVGAGRAQGEQTLDLRVPIVRPEVEVEPIETDLRIGDRQEQQTGKSRRRSSDLDDVVFGIEYCPSERVAPPLSERFRIERVHRQLFEFQCHNSHIPNPGILMSAIIR